MARVLSGQYIGLRDKSTNKIISVYPEKIDASDDEIKKIVKDWHYAKSCEAENDLSTSFVDLLTDTEINSKNLK